MTDTAIISDAGFALHVTGGAGAGFSLTYFGPSCAAHGTEPLPVLPAGPDRPPGPRLLAMRGDGYDGISHIEAVRLEDGRAAHLIPVSIEQVSGTALHLHSADEAQGLGVTLEIRLGHGLLHMRTRVRNGGPAPVLLIRCAALLLPLPDWADEVISGYGAWAREGHTARRRLDAGFSGKASRLGRTGFDGPPGIVICAAGTTETVGRALGAQLAWSGSHRIHAERLRDGAVELCAEAIYEPGEILIGPDETFETPEALVVLSEQGLDGLRDVWHAHARRQVRPVTRPVHFNTWEARYFGFDEPGLIELAGQAARLGVERFVLDDGWFAGRRDDRTSLGDWTPDPDRFPNGLAPLIRAVNDLGMSFGLWVEPEMVSRQSHLYRARPDWVLAFPEEAAPTGRNQLVLDLSNPEVVDHLFGTLSGLLRPGGIDYLKWDCNRELYPASRNGRLRATAQVRGLYDLLDRLQAAFPELEIESCASGGGRIDFGILPRVMRFWASDATDAADRIRIQDSLSRYIPAEMIGSHVGPSPNPITARAFPMAFRGLVSMFGHMGVELDPAKLDAGDHATLTQAIALHKKLRPSLQAGTYKVLETGDASLHVSGLFRAGSGEFLLRVLRTAMSVYPLQARITVPGLPGGARYRVRELVLGEESGRELGILTAETLAWAGFQGDPRRPDHGRLFHFLPIR
ncbi:alpha-galactosidase [Hyphomonas sp.]|uniref:alpha-galactosidase n=1 Tax=Hyphomonas sp. TaxID=87 RepID=UPI001BD0BFDF|nr:alpha-galactosidase [Hyphomonas sp.]